MGRQQERRGMAPRPAWIGSVLPLTATIVVEFVALGVFVLLLRAHVPVAVTIGITALVALIGLLISTLRAGGISVPTRIRRRWAYVRRPRRGAGNDVPMPFDAPTADGTLVGLRWDGGRVISVIRIGRPPQLLALSPNMGVVTGHGLRLGVVARALRQFDIELESIDVLTHGWRVRGVPHLTGAYSNLIGPLPVISHQDVWLVVRLNPLQCPDAIGARGGGSTGVIRTATAATQRLANYLGEAGYLATPLNANAIARLHRQLVDGADLESAEESWAGVDFGQFHTSSYALTRELDERTLTGIWTAPAVSTVVVHSISTEPRSKGFGVRTVVRYNGVRNDHLTTIPELTRIDGAQRPALNLSFPVARPDQVPVPTLVGTSEDLDAIRIPDGGCGQLLGADVSGQAAAINLFGSDVQRVILHGTLYLAEQIVARASAIGARILIHTDRPDAWRRLVESVGNPSLLWVSAWQTSQRNAITTYDLCVLDSAAAMEEPAIASHLRVNRTPLAAFAVPPGVDIVIGQDPNNTSGLIVMTARGRRRVTLVATPAENQLLGNLVQQQEPPVPPVERAPRRRERPPTLPPLATAESGGRHSSERIRRHGAH